jgi:flagellar protein FliS
MYGKSNALASYGKIANSEADPIHQVVLLYDGAIKFSRLAADDIQNGRIADKAEHDNRTLDIINYLQSILDFERAAEVAQTLDNLYSLVSMTVLQASAKLDAAGMLKAADLLIPVRDSWDAVAKTIGSTPVEVMGKEPKRLELMAG